MLVALDTETGGLYANTNPILSLAIWSPELEESEAGPFKIGIHAEGMSCSPRALEVNGLDPMEGVSRLVAADMLMSWWDKLGKPTLHLIGHNVGPFDVPFLRQLPRLPFFDYHYRDTSVLALALEDMGILNGKLSLTSVANQLGIFFEAHDALNDAKATWHCWHRMIEILKDQDRKELKVYQNDGKEWIAPYGWPLLRI